MKRLIFLILIITSLLYSYEEERWKGKVFKEGEITVVENRGNGIWGDKIKDKIFFKETLSIGTEKGVEDLVFGNGISVAVDLDGSIYILDSKNYRLLKFDRNGKFLWKAGRKGEGPGEFRSGGQVKISPDGRIAVSDNGNIIHFFSRDGRFLNTIKFDRFLMGIDFLRDGRIFASLMLQGQSGYSAEFYSKEGKFLGKFQEEYAYGPKFSPGIGATVGRGFHLSGNRVYLCLPDRYEIREYDLDGKCLRKIRRDLKIKPPEIKVGEGFVRIRAHDVYGPIYILKDGTIVNNLWIEEKEEREYYLDFFDPKGKFLGSYKLSEDEKLLLVDSKDNFYFLHFEPFTRIIRKEMKII
jgi:hypothetical protein